VARALLEVVTPRVLLADFDQGDVKMIRSQWIAGAVLGSLVALAACDRNDPRAEEERARAAQAQADESVAKAQAEAQKKIDEARREANKETTEAMNEANHETAEAQKNANEKIRSANENVLEKKNDIKEWANKKLGEMDTRIDESKTKAQKAAPSVKEKFQRALEDVDAKRDTVRGRIASLDSQTAAALEDTKDRLDKDFSEFQTSVKRLEGTL